MQEIASFLLKAIRRYMIDYGISNNFLNLVFIVVKDVCFFRFAPPVHYGKIMIAERASHPVNGRHSTESNASHICNNMLE